MPSRPTGLTLSWANNRLILYWQHPDSENGPIRKFLIVLALNSTKLLAMPDKTNFVEQYEISSTQKYYNYMVKYIADKIFGPESVFGGLKRPVQLLVDRIGKKWFS